LINRFTAALLLIVLCSLSIAAGEESKPAPYWDWLGVGPIFSYGSLFNPYLSYYPATLPSGPAVQPYAGPAYSGPYYYYKPTYAQTWWVGEHKDMEKVIERARSGSSMRVFSGGFWRTP